MTTEDSGFFKHRGWVSAQFKTALRRNLAGGGFRLGASSITMQMVKNVILSREKTLSRKFQELFLVWFVEQILTKQRILEL
jgi:membrane peptidoglycan carboxypeptidase